MEIRKCTPADYPELLDVLNDAFGFGRENEWFQKETTHCTPYPSQATAEEIGLHWICIIDGKIAGGLGAYPMDWVVSGADGQRYTISAYGIGQVCCLPEFRNRGVMSAMMKAAEADMRERGRSVGYLEGSRRRYGYFGYDFGGSAVIFRLDKKLLELTTSPGLVMRQAKLEDWPTINEACTAQPSYVVRSARSWELQFSRTNMRWFIGESGSNKGYMCVRSDNMIVEIHGDPGILAAMLLDRANGLEEGKSLAVMHSAQNVMATPEGQMLTGAAGWVESYPNGLFVVLDAAQLLDELGINHTDMPAAIKESVARQLLNFTPLPEKRQYIQPLHAWIPKVDSI